MRGKTVVITGASRGIGHATARALHGQGASLVLVVRDRTRGDEVRRELLGDGAPGSVELVVADVSVQAEVRRAAREIEAAAPRFDVLVNNAGAIFNERKVSRDGLELTFATNHVAYFLLTMELEGRLTANAPCRVVNVSSEAHRNAHGMAWDDLQFERRWSTLGAYAQSKLANILFTRELARRMEGRGVTANALHPGVIASGFGRNNKGFLGLLVRAVAPFLASEEEGAKTSVHLASAREVEGVTGKYFVKSKEVWPTRFAQDDDAAARLWRVTEELVARSAAVAA